MQLVEFGKKLNTPVVICLGYFGCMHKGHVGLVDVAKRRAAECGAKVALFTFSNNHLKVLGKEPTVVYTFDERLLIYESLGIDFVIAGKFDESFRATTGDEFLNELLRYNVKGVVFGTDYCCGSDRMNSIAARDKLLSTCTVDIVDTMLWHGEKISTTAVRKLLGSGDVATANQLLSEPYFVTGEVEAGRHVGKSMGFPTANLKISSEKALPIGVYGGHTVVDGNLYRCIVNIGHKPTFAVDSVTIEVHLINFNGNLYGRTLKVSLTKYLRGIQKFANADELSAQLARDKESVLHD